MGVLARKFSILKRIRPNQLLERVPGQVRVLAVIKRKLNPTRYAPMPSWETCLQPPATPRLNSDMRVFSRETVH